MITANFRSCFAYSPQQVKHESTFQENCIKASGTTMIHAACEQGGEKRKKFGNSFYYLVLWMYSFQAVFVFKLNLSSLTQGDSSSWRGSFVARGEVCMVFKVNY